LPTHSESNATAIRPDAIKVKESKEKKNSGFSPSGKRNTNRPLDPGAAPSGMVY